MPNIRKVKFTDKMNTKIQVAAISAYPGEACGLVISTGKNKFEVVECKNVADDKRNYFVMDAEDQIKAEELGDIVGVWHNHVERPADASEADKAGCEATGVPWFITALYRGELEEPNWSFSETKVITPSGFAMPYLERPYVFGVFDCWLLVRDYLKREFNVELDVLPELHIPRWWESNVDILGDNYKSQGLVRLEEGTEPQNGDVFFMQFGAGVPNHCAVYIGDDMILHHQQDRLSCRSIYGGGHYFKHTTHHMRHKDLM